MRVIDSHVHFPAKKIIDDGKPDGTQSSAWVQDEKKVHPWITADRAKWRAAWRFPDPVETTPEEAERLWEAECERYDYLERVVFVTAGGNAKAAGLVERHSDSFIAYAHHDPFLPDATERLEKALHSEHLRGYKILAPMLDGFIGDKSLYPLWEIAQQADVPVLIHFGIEGAAGGIANHININPLSIHGVAKDFPDLKIIVPHFGCGYIFETLNLCWACPNVFIDTSGSNQWMRWMPYEVNLEILFRKYYETIGPGRIIFGTDSSWFPRGFATAYLDEQVRSMVYVGYGEDEIDAVLYRNAASLLKIA